MRFGEKQSEISESLHYSENMLNVRNLFHCDHLYPANGKFN